MTVLEPHSFDSSVSVGGQCYLPCLDAMGNVAAYLDESGVEVASFTYSAFGETLIQSGSLRGAFPFRFSTKWHETAVTEFCDYGRRWYWPVYGRWISRDPIMIPQTVKWMVERRSGSILSLNKEAM